MVNYIDYFKIEKCKNFETELETGEKINISKHKKTCGFCQESKKVLKDVEYKHNLKIGWKEPKCPFCFSEIEKPEEVYLDKKNDEIVGYKIMKCKCGVAYSLDIFCENEDILEYAAEILRVEEHELVVEDLSDKIDVVILHNYNIQAHAFNIYLDFLYDIIDPDARLGHLWFLKTKE